MKSRMARKGKKLQYGGMKGFKESSVVRDVLRDNKDPKDARKPDRLQGESLREEQTTDPPAFARVWATDETRIER